MLMEFKYDNFLRIFEEDMLQQQRVERQLGPFLGQKRFADDTDPQRSAPALPATVVSPVIKARVPMVAVDPDVKRPRHDETNLSSSGLKPRIAALRARMLTAAELGPGTDTPKKPTTTAPPPTMTKKQRKKAAAAERAIAAAAEEAESSACGGANMKMAMEPIKKAAGDVFATKARKHGNLASDAVLQLMRRAEPSNLYTAVERAAAAGGVTPSLVKAAEDEAKELNYVDDVPFGAGRALNVDVFAIVLEQLPFSAAVNARLVCNAWNRAIVTSNHWHMVHTNRVEEKRRRLYERSVVADIPGAAFYFLLHRREQDRFVCDSCFCWVKAQWFKNSLGAVLPVYIGDNPNRAFALSRDEKIVKPPTLYIPDRADPNYIYLCLPCRLDYFKKHPHPPILCNPHHRFSWNSLRKMFPISKPMQRSIRSTFALKPDTEAPIGIIVEKMRQVYGGDPGIAAAIISRRYSGKTPA